MMKNYGYVQIVFDTHELLEQVRSEVAWLNLNLSPNLDKDEAKICWREYNDSKEMLAEAKELIFELGGKLSAWNADVKESSENISIILYLPNNAVKAVALLESHLRRYLKCRLLAKKLSIVSPGIVGSVRLRYEQLMEESTAVMEDVLEVLCLAENNQSL